MKQLWYVNKTGQRLRDRVELREVDMPEIVESRQVKVKIAYAALCATDIHMMTQGVFGAQPPMPLGHEASALIVEAGPEVEGFGFKVGDKVVMTPASSCGFCAMCKKGLRQYCLNVTRSRVFAEYAVVDVSAIFKIPDDADMPSYALTEPAQCTVRAMDLTPIPHGATVAVSGVGGIGAIMLNQILLSGAAQITALDPVPEKRDLALSMGAQFVIDPFNESVLERTMEITNGEGFNYVFEVSGSVKAAQTPIDILSKCGTVSYFAVFPPTYEFPLNLYELYLKEGRLQTVFCDPVLMPRTIALIPRMQTEKIIGKKLPLSDALDALDLFEQSIYPKILLDCSN